MVGIEEANALWAAVRSALSDNDERRLWLAWKRAYRLRFWKVLEFTGPGQICVRDGISHQEILKRITRYELSPDRDKAADEAELARDGVPPSDRFSI